MSAPAASLTQPAAPRRPRLLKRPVSQAQREAARRNGVRSRGPQTAAGKAHSSRNARRYGLYARLHLFNAEEKQAFRAELQCLFERLDPRDPADVALVSELALASFQFRRAFGLDPESLARNPRDITSIVRMVRAIGKFESRYTRILYRSLAGIDNLEKQAAERKSGKQTRELIEQKENAPARQVNPARRLGCGPDRHRVWRLASRFPTCGYARTPTVSFEDLRTRHFNVAHPRHP